MVTPRRVSTTGRVRAALFPRRNPLRRPSDRWETASWWGALVLLVLLIPVVPAVSGARSTAVRDEAAVVRATAHPVDATVVAVSTPVAGVDGEFEDGSTVVVGWTDPDGATRTASRETYGARPRVGDAALLWVDPGRSPVPPPSTDQDAALEGAVAGVAAVVGWCLGIAGALVLVRWLLDRHRMRRWDEDRPTSGRRRNRGAAG